MIDNDFACNFCISLSSCHFSWYMPNDWLEYPVQVRDGGQEASLSAGTETNKDAGVYVGVEDDESTEDDDGLGDAWMEMSLALESSKV